MKTTLLQSKDAEVPLPLRQRLSFAIHRINALLQQLANPLFQEFGLDLVTSRLMVAVLEQGSVSVGELAELLATPQPSVSHQIKRLERLGYLSRAAEQRDSRRVLLRLTPRGREVAVSLDAYSREVMGLLEAAIGEAELVKVQEALERVDRLLQSRRAASPRKVTRLGK
ncbi:MAG: MarR family winged helix-turn-helix transcriptional regulator [Steroidobacteraceae bacterium]